MNLLVAFALLLCSFESRLGALPQDKQDSDLERAARALARQIGEKPAVGEDLFHPKFLKQIPIARVNALCKELHTQYGAITSARQVADESEHAGVFHFVFDERTRLAVSLSVEAEPPHRVTGLWLGSPRPVRRSVEDVAEAMKKLHGETGMALVRLGESPLTMAEHNGDRRLAIGSSFKIYVLGALLESDRAKEPGAWSRVVPLREEHLSHPSGFLHQWKPGSPVTVHTLAALMISQSDNTATDHLLFTVGRERVEAVMAEMGHGDPKRNRPFLSTLEAFKLKSSEELRKKFAAADEAGRRKLLDGPVRAMERDAVEFGPGSHDIDQIEWFASPLELCLAMDWLRRRTEDPALAAGRDILAVNAGVRTLKRAWKFVGFKGGSETGVLNLTFLLQTAGGQWYALSASWNDGDQALDDNQFIDLVQDVVYLLQRE